MPAPLQRLWRFEGRNEALALVGLFLAIRLLPRSVPIGIYGVGVVDGARVALQAIALVLVFRSNRIINFAQAAYASSAALLFAALVEYRPLLRVIDPVCVSDCTTNPLAVNINYWVSAAVALGFVVFVGWATYFLIVRRFANAPRLLLTVATIFVGYTVSGVVSYLVRWMTPAEVTERGTQAGTVPATLPFDFSLRLDVVTFDAAAFVTIGVAAAMAFGLFAYLRGSATGTAIRAASENADRASTLGINVGSLTGRVWMAAAALGALGGMLGAMAEGPAAASAGSGSEVGILAAAVIARFASLPMAGVAAIVLSVLQQAMQWNGKSALFDVTLFVVIGVLLLLQSARMSRAEQALVGEWRAAREVRPIPRELRSVPTVQTWMRVGFGAAAVLLLGYPWLVEPVRVATASLIMLYTIIGLSLLVLTGWAGQISLGQVAFAAIGAFVVGATGLPLAPAVLLAVVAGGVAALVVGLPALRLRGLHLAVLTLAFHQAVVVLALSPNRYLGQLLRPTVDAPVLLGMRFDDQRVFYYFALAATAAAIVGVVGMRRSRTARALLATRDNEQAAQAFGINLTRARVGAFAVSGMMSAFAGALMAYHQGGVQAGAFDLGLSRTVFLYSVIGGLGSVAGPVIGFAYYALPVLMQLPGIVALLLSGPGGLIILLLTPGGVGQLVFDARDNWLRKIARRHRIAVPSLLADAAADAHDEPVPLAPKARPGGAPAFVPERYQLPEQWAIDGVGVMQRSTDG